ncbi:amino acid permease, partial [Staphylococcus simulans]
MLYSMSKDKLAYNSFGKTNKSGVPYVSLIATGVLVILIFALQHLSGDAYEYIVAASGMTGFIAWVGIAISHFRFRRAFDKQNYDKSKLK